MCGQGHRPVQPETRPDSRFDPNTFGTEYIPFRVERSRMSHPDLTDSERNDLPEFLRTDHPGSWSANLEDERYADDRALLVEHALVALERTTSGHHVNLVTHPEHGRPDEYLAEAIAELAPEADAEVVDQCGCGGYVYRVEV